MAARLVRSLPAWLGVAVILGGVAVTSVSAQDVSYDLAKQGVVHVFGEREIEGFDGSTSVVECIGSGVIVHITPDRIGYILTNYHVVKSCLGRGSTLSVKVDGQTIPAEVYRRQRPESDGDPAIDPGRDLALLVTTEGLPAEGVEDLLLADENQVLEAVNAGERVAAYGYPGGDVFARFNGNLNSISGGDLLFTVYEREPPAQGPDNGSALQIKGGASGGALMSRNGLVLGINKEFQHDYNRCIRADIVRSVIEGWELELLPRPTPIGKVGIWFTRIPHDEPPYIQGELITSVRQEAWGNDLLRPRIEVVDLERTLWITTDSASHAEACRLGEAVNATLVGWADLTASTGGGHDVSPRLSLVRRPEAHGSLAMLRDITFTPQPYTHSGDDREEARKNLDLLRKFILGYCYYEIEEYEYALGKFEVLLSDPALKKDEFIGDLQLLSGIAHWRLSECKDRKEHLQQAIHHYKQARKYCDARERIRIAHIRNNLGLAYLDFPTSWWERRPWRWLFFWKRRRLEKAIEEFKRARKTYAKRGKDFEYAAAQSNLSMAHNRSKEYKKAIDSCREALRICEKRFLFAIDAGFCTDLESKGLSGNLRKEFEKRKVSLSQDIVVSSAEGGSQWLISDRDTWKSYILKRNQDRLDIHECPYPLLCAATCNNMGVAHFYLSKRANKQENIEKAIAAYEDALEIRHKDVLPIGYAKVQYNLGLAYEDRGSGSRRENLERAVHAYEEALDIYQEYFGIDGAFGHEVKTVRRHLKDVHERLDESG